MSEGSVVKASEKSKPLVSVIMATFNEEPDMIGKSISSIMDQTYKNFELLIFDDSTKQETKEKIDSFTTDRSSCQSVPVSLAGGIREIIEQRIRGSQRKVYRPDGW